NHHYTTICHQTSLPTTRYHQTSSFHATRPSFIHYKPLHIITLHYLSPHTITLTNPHSIPPHTINSSYLEREFKCFHPPLYPPRIHIPALCTLPTTIALNYNKTNIVGLNEEGGQF